VFSTFRTRLATRATAVGVATVLLGAGVAAAATGNLPAPAQEAVAGVASQLGINMPNAADELPEQAAAGQATAAANQTFAEEIASSAQEFTDAVQETVGEYTTALDAWTDCVADNASERGSTQSNADTRTEGEFDPTEGCGEKPVLVVPNPADFGLGATGNRPEEAGPPPDVPQGPPEEAGPPADVPQGPPEEAGPPPDVPEGPPEEAGPPSAQP
jgi:hypothetical protein